MLEFHAAAACCFRRRTELQETFEQCLAEVPKRFITGSVNGQFIGLMKKFAQDIVPLALNNQLQEPQITNIISMEPENQNECEANSNQNIEHPIDSIYTSRPSDFRIKSICESMTTKFVDHFEYVSDQKDNRHKQCHQQQRVNRSTTRQTAAPKSIRKLFDEYIADFNATIERYCEIVIA